MRNAIRQKKLGLSLFRRSDRDTMGRPRARYNVTRARIHSDLSYCDNLILFGRGVFGLSKLEAS